MAEQSAQTLEKYDVYIVYGSEDIEKADQINHGLREKGLITCADYQDFKIGRSIFDNIIGAISRSKVVMILLTENTLNSSMVTFEVMMSLEKSHREGHMCLRLLFVDVTDKEKEEFKRGKLDLIPEITVDFKRKNWEQELVDKINEELPMRNLLPAGNVAHGLVFNYYIGYLAYVLPATATAMTECKYCESGRISTKFFIMIPDSCKVTPPEIGKHGGFKIEKMPDPLEVAVEHGGKKRTYNPAVYKITRNATSESYLFTGDSPFILNTMSKMKEMGFADIDLDFQVVRFRLTLTELVEHRSNKECNSTAIFIRYSGNEGSLAQELWSALDNESALPVDLKIRTKEGRRLEANEHVTFATITYAQESDQGASQEIEDFLKSKEVTFTNGGGQMHLSYLAEGRWNIFILSERSVKDPVMCKQFEAAIAASISNDLVQVIPILASGSDIRKIPSKFRWATVLKQDEPHYKDKLWDTMNAEGLKMSEKLPAGDVYEGLAYSYLINYIPFNLTMNTESGRDFKQRFEDAKKKFNANCIVVPKVFIIVSVSCSFPAPGYKFEREEHLGEMEPVKQGFRIYGLHLYRLTMSDGKQVCYSREYATPAVALHNMAKLPFAGITVEQKNEQVQKFTSFCGQIMGDKTFNEQIGNIRDKCELVYFDDEKHGLDGMMASLEECLLENIHQGHIL